MKKAYAPYEGHTYTAALPGGKTIRLDAGDTYETSDAVEQSELDALASRADSGLKDVTKKGKAD